MSLRTYLMTAVLCVSFATNLFGQVHVGVRGANGYRGVGVGYGWGGWGGANFASTPAEGYARGMANVIQAQGQAYQDVTAGMANYEQARTSYIQNEMLWHQTSLERERMGMERRAQYYASERALRERRDAMAEHAPPPAKLSATQYDRATGLVKWPEGLQTAGFADGRKSLEELLVTRAHTGDSAAVDQQILEVAKKMQTQLKGQIRDLSPNVYLEARKFLDLLTAETRESAAL